jgi:hypothetical protein
MKQKNELKKRSHFLIYNMPMDHSYGYKQVFFSVLVFFLLDHPGGRSWYIYQELCHEEGQSVLFEKGYAGSSVQEGHYWTPMFRTFRYIIKGKYMYYNTHGITLYNKGFRYRLK